jgi:hypothetical protein
MGLCFSDDETPVARPVVRPAQNTAQNTTVITYDPNMEDGPRQVSRHRQYTKPIDDVHNQKRKPSSAGNTPQYNTHHNQQRDTRTYGATLARAYGDFRH